MKNSNDTIGNRTRDLSTCSAVPKPTAAPRASYETRVKCNIGVEHRLRVFENRVLRTIFGPKSIEVTRGVEKTT